jgi:uncharacterized protein YbjT (DUF2867 family)
MTVSNPDGRRRSKETNMASILLAGGTGTVGRHIVKGLVARGLSPRVLSRDPDNARRLLGDSVEIVHGDLMNPASLSDALRGVEVAYVATTPGPELVAQEVHFVDAARAAEVRRVVKLSGYGTDVATDRIHRWHAASEQRLESSGLGYVILQPVMFMSNLLWEAESIKRGVIASAFGDGRMSFVDPSDVAEVAVVALTIPDLANGVWGFGGPEALSYDDVAATFSRVLGRRVEHVRLDEQAFRQATAGLPELVVDAIASSAVMAQQGTYEVPDRVIRERLGRRGRTLESWIAAHRAAFAA